MAAEAAAHASPQPRAHTARLLPLLPLLLLLPPPLAKVCKLPRLAPPLLLVRSQHNQYHRVPGRERQLLTVPSTRCCCCCCCCLLCATPSWWMLPLLLAPCPRPTTTTTPTVTPQRPLHRPLQLLHGAQHAGGHRPQVVERPRLRAGTWDTWVVQPTCMRSKVQGSAAYRKTSLRMQTVPSGLIPLCPTCCRYPRSHPATQAHRS